MIHSKRLFTILSLVLGLFVMVSCGDTAEKAADTTEDAVEAVEEAAGDAVDAVKAAAGDAVDAAGEAVDAVKEAVDKSGKEYTSAYVCPMHCAGSGSDAAGKCPACGMDYVVNEHAGHSH